MMQKRKERLQMVHSVRSVSLWSTIQLMFFVMLSLFTLIQMQTYFSFDRNSINSNTRKNINHRQEKEAIGSIQVSDCLKKIIFSSSSSSSSSSSKTNTSIQRGIVLPLFDEIALLGKSLLMEIRVFDQEIPIEIPFCGDLNEKNQFLFLNTTKDSNLFLYDICQQAVSCFCKKSLQICHQKFRSFDIKILSVLFSQFNEVMLIDADTLFFETPTSLWQLESYQKTGNFFFRDRINYNQAFLAKRIKNKQEISVLHVYLSKMNLSSSFKQLEIIPRSKASVKNQIGIDLLYEPSDELLKSHAWHLRSGHLLDSSLLLWNKQKQPRATAILGSFLLNDGDGLPRPPSYGDKELFFFACEIAETSMSLSEFGVGAIGNYYYHEQKEQTIFCGEALHFYPTKQKSTELLYINSDDILKYDLSQPLYHTIVRGWEQFSTTKNKKLPSKCFFNVTLQSLTPKQMDTIKKRQQAYQEAEKLLLKYEKMRTKIIRNE